MSATDQHRVLLVDDQDAVRSGLRDYLELTSNWRVCGEAANGSEGAREAARLEPDLIIIDITMPVMDGIQATREIRKALPETPILMLSCHDTPGLIGASFLAGATGYLLKENLGQELLRAVDAVWHHQRFLSSGLGDAAAGARG